MQYFSQCVWDKWKYSLGKHFLSLHSKYECSSLSSDFAWYHALFLSHSCHNGFYQSTHHTLYLIHWRYPWKFRPNWHSTFCVTVKSSVQMDLVRFDNSLFMNRQHLLLASANFLLSKKKLKEVIAKILFPLFFDQCKRCYRNHWIFCGPIFVQCKIKAF